MDVWVKFKVQMGPLRLGSGVGVVGRGFDS